MRILFNVDTMKKNIIKGFVFLGPVGSLIPSFTEFDAFRFYYFLLPVGIALFLLGGVNSTAIVRLLILLPILFYMVFSNNISILLFNSTAQIVEPLSRLLLVLALIVFSVLAGTIAAEYDYRTKVNLIVFYVSGYIVSLISGYILYIGYYINLFSLEFIGHFQVLTQVGYGFLRFSPGSYPNEYGIVSSFVLALITFLLIEHKNLISKKNKPIKILFLIILFIFTFIALILATTRAAYITYFLSILYLSCKGSNIRKKFKRIFYIIAAIVLFILFYQINVVSFVNVVDVINVIERAYINVSSNQDSNVNARFFSWEIAYIDFIDTPFFGVGFGTNGSLHNTYLQLLFGLGTIGTTLLLLCIITFVLYEKSKKTFCVSKYFEIVINLAVIQVLFFAASNHNLNHHLTWFCLFLYLMSQENLRHTPNPLNEQIKIQKSTDSKNI